MRPHEIMWMVGRLWDGAHIEFADRVAVVYLPTGATISRDDLGDLLDQADAGDWRIGVVDGDIYIRMSWERP